MIFEAFPYWLNGALPLAVLLNDTEMLGDIRPMFSMDEFIHKNLNQPTHDGRLCLTGV